MSIRECVKCEATKTDGRRCTRSTCVYPGMCWQHFQKEHHLKLAPSGIPNAGLGLFTMRDIEPNERIVEYTGRVRGPSEGIGGNYVLEVSKNPPVHIDAASTQSSIARYANHCRQQNERARNCRGNNAKYRKYRGHIYVRASKRIPAGQEVFVSYGNSYWRNIDPAAAPPTAAPPAAAPPSKRQNQNPQTKPQNGWQELYSNW